MASDDAVNIPLSRDARAIVERASEIAKQRGEPETTSNDVLVASWQLQPQLVPVPAGSGVLGTPGLPLQRLLINAGREAQSMGQHQVTPSHLLLAMLYSDSPSTALPLQQAGLTLYGVRQRAQVQAPRPALRGGVIAVSPVFLGIVGTGAVSGALLWTNLVPGLVVPITIVFVVAGWITSLCIHEFGHAIVAYMGGDRAVASAGYLTLDPLRYTNVMLSIVLPVVFLLLGGIALPGGAVYINHSALRSKAWSSAVSLAGPAGTFVGWLAIAGAFGALFRQGVVTSDNFQFFGALAVLGFYLTFALVLNLLPVPGLDGFGIIRPWLSYQLQYSLMRYGTLAILGVYVVLWFVAPVRDAFFRIIFQITSAAGIPLDLVFLGLFNMRIAT